MRLLTSPSPALSYLVIGEGLIGRAIIDHLINAGYQAEYRGHDWQQAGPISAATALLNAYEGRGPLQVIWSAGNTDMTTTSYDQRESEQLFSGWLDDLSDILVDHEWKMHYVSSAGALGEPGHDDWNRQSPYAQAKSYEESYGFDNIPAFKVYRVASVFGAAPAGSRQGVIGTMIGNALHGKETALFARMTTLRNYVYDQDVAATIIRTAMYDSTTDPVLIAARRSTSMTEVVSTVSDVIRKPVPVRYTAAQNDHNMVFDASLVSPYFPDRPLRAAVRRVFDRQIAV